MVSTKQVPVANTLRLQQAESKSPKVVSNILDNADLQDNINKMRKRHIINIIKPNIYMAPILSSHDN